MRGNISSGNQPHPCEAYASRSIKEAE